MAFELNTSENHAGMISKRSGLSVPSGWHDDLGPTALKGCLLVAMLLFVVLSSGSLVGCEQKHQQTSEHQLQDSDETARFQSVTLNGEVFILQLALDADARFQGLSDVKEIPEDGGMLFVFPRPRELNFVMRKCLVPIDLIYIGPGGRVVSMHRMKTVPYDTPESQLEYYSSGWPAQFVIELREGSIDRLGVKIGQKIDLPLVSLKAEAS